MGDFKEQLKVGKRNVIYRVYGNSKGYELITTGTDLIKIKSKLDDYAHVYKRILIIEEDRDINCDTPVFLGVSVNGKIKEIGGMENER